ncbi:MAG: phosphoribosyltransferase [Promethearchaeota archaeon]
MNNIELTHLTWNEIETYCRKIANEIRNADFKPEIIVGIQRGGSITAVLLSHLLKIEVVCTIGIRTTESDDTNAQRVKPIIYDPFSLKLVSGKTVLLTDDISDTGTTLIEAMRELSKYGAKDVRSATLVRAPASNSEVNFYGEEIKPWIVFPWEI